jgi:hypothetical protein
MIGPFLLVLVVLAFAYGILHCTDPYAVSRKIHKLEERVKTVPIVFLDLPEGSRSAADAVSECVSNAKKARSEGRYDVAWMHMYRGNNLLEQAFAKANEPRWFD